MDEARMTTLASAAPVGRLATVDADGRPYVVPFCFVIEGDLLYSAVDNKPKTTTDLKRLRNIREVDRVSVVIDHYEDDWSKLWWIRLDGIARIVDDGGERARALSLLAAKYPQYRESTPAGAVLAVTITRRDAWDARGLG